MAKRRPHHGPQTAARDTKKTVQHFLAATGILSGCILAVAIFMLYSPQQEVQPPANIDSYSSYRWGNCDTHPGQCSREYSTSDTATVMRLRPCMTGLNCPCTKMQNSTGTPIIYTFSLFNERCHLRRYVGLREARPMYVYGRVAKEYEDLVRAGIDALRLEKVVMSLSQMSSGNIGELIALKRPDLEEHYWEEMKNFVQHNPRSEPPKKLQDLFKRWYLQDITILPGKAQSSKLPLLGDFKWTIRKHSQLDIDQRYTSEPFFAGGQPWRLIYCPRSDWDETQFAIYLTPVASQHSRPGWLRQVSFNVRVHGHDSPSQSIWANWKHTYSVLDEDFVSGFPSFMEHEILHMPGRGYLKNDTLEMRVIVRLDAVANMGPITEAPHQAYNLASLAVGIGSMLKEVMRPAADWKPLALRLRDIGSMSLVTALRPSSWRLDAFWAWCMSLLRQAASAHLYLSHLKLLILASGLAAVVSLARGWYTFLSKGDL